MRDVVDALTAFPERGACTDAERRAALWLHDDLRERGYEAWLETVWVRPQWAWSLVWHGTLGVALSLVSTAVAQVGVGAILVALSLGLEFVGVPVLARLFYRRATQIVVVEPPGPGINLWLVAHTDAPRSAAAFRERWRRVFRRVPVAWLAIVSLVAIAVLGGVRTAGTDGGWVGLVQMVPTVVLLAFVAVALDSLLNPYSPGASDAGGVAVALALHEELTRRAPERLSVGLLLCGAGEAWPYGFRAWRRLERPAAAETVVVELGPCGGGEPVWDARQPQLAEAATGRRVSVRRPSALTLRLPSLYVRTIGSGGVPPRVRSPHDTASAVDEATLDAVYDLVLDTVDRLDAALARSASTSSGVTSTSSQVKRTVS